MLMLTWRLYYGGAVITSITVMNSKVSINEKSCVSLYVVSIAAYQDYQDRLTKELINHVGLSAHAHNHYNYCARG